MLVELEPTDECVRQQCIYAFVAALTIRGAGDRLATPARLPVAAPGERQGGRRVHEILKPMRSRLVPARRHHNERGPSLIRSLDKRKTVSGGIESREGAAGTVDMDGDVEALFVL